MNKQFTCLMYHEIVSPKKTKFSVDPSMFETQMRALREAGVTSLVLDSKAQSTSIYRCLLTFDDGHVSNLQAARVMYELGLIGYFYLLKDNSLEQSDYLKEGDIKEMAALGHQFGVHGKNHGWWTKKTSERLVSELRETKDWIEQLTGKAVITCSAPGGFIDQRTLNCIRNRIPELKYIRTSHYGYNNECDTVLRSIGVKSCYSSDKVLHIAQNEWLTMQKIMAYYYAKEAFKPLYYWAHNKFK